LRRLDELTESHPTSEEFFGRLIHMLTDVVGGDVGQIWQAGENDIEAMVRASRGEWDGDDQLAEEKSFVLDVFQNPLPTLRVQDSTGGHEAFPTPCFLMVPISDHLRCFAVVSIVVHVDVPQTAEGMLAIVTAVCERVSKSYIATSFSQSARDLARVNKAIGVMTGVGKHLDVKAMAYEVVNRLQQYLKADRATLALKRGSKCSIKGISNQAVFDRRSNVVRQLERLATQVAKTEEPLWFPADESEMAPAQRRTIERYFELSDTMSMALLPILADRTQREDPEDIAATIRSSEANQECVDSGRN